MGSVIALVPNPPLWPKVRRRLEHAVKQTTTADRLNDESLAMAWLFQHASTAARLRLYEYLRANECDCLSCQRRRADADREQKRHA